LVGFDGVTVTVALGMTSVLIAVASGEMEILTVSDGTGRLVAVISTVFVTLGVDFATCVLMLVSVAISAVGREPGLPLLNRMNIPPTQQLATTRMLLRKINGWLLIYRKLFNPPPGY
jgi:hypothetical protein